MIKLIELLQEITGIPKAIIMAGGAGVGKGTFIEKLATIKKQSENKKKEYEEFLKLLEPNNPTVKTIIKSFKPKEEVLSKVETFLNS